MKKCFVFTLLLGLLSVSCALAVTDADFPQEMPTGIRKALLSDWKTGTSFLAYERVTEDEAFALLLDAKNTATLYGFTQAQSGWKRWLRTSKAVPQARNWGEIVTLDRYAGDLLDAQNSRQTAGRPVISLTLMETNGEYEVERVSYERQGKGDWRLIQYVNHQSDTALTANEASLTYYDDANDAWPIGTAYGTVQTDMRYVSLSVIPKSLAAAREKLTSAPAIPAGELTATNIHFTGGKQYAVYSGPGEGFVRGGNGKAQVSTNDWIQVFGTEDGWMLIQYAISRNQMRFGYIPETALPAGTRVQALDFFPIEATLMRRVSLTDDPLFSQYSLGVLEAGEHVIWLSTMGADAYVEVSLPEGEARGFVPIDALIVDGNG